SCLGNGCSQLVMCINATSKTTDIVDQHKRLPGLELELARGGQQRMHAGPVDKAAGYTLILVHIKHLVAFKRRIFAAARLLRGQAMPFPHLLEAGYAAVD